MAPASYAMTWRVGDGPRRAGRVELRPDSVELEATSPPGELERVPFEQIVRVALLHGILRLDRVSMPPLRLFSLDGPGALRELADRVSAAAHAPS